MFGLVAGDRAITTLARAPKVLISRTFSAPEWTRTTTRETPDKALNLVQKV